MSVLIKGMKMPTSCFYCPFRIKVDPDNIKCLVSGVVFEETFTGSIEMRHSGDCPLIPVQQHGDLINRDALCGRLEKAGKIKPHLESGLNVAISFALTAPTIIPAEECET